MKTFASLCCSAVSPDSVASPAQSSPYLMTNKCVLSGLNMHLKGSTSFFDVANLGMAF